MKDHTADHHLNEKGTDHLFVREMFTGESCFILKCNRCHDIYYVV